MTTSPPKPSALPDPPLTPKAAATRTRLLDLAAQLFTERGYDAVSLRDLAAAAGLTKGAIYGHFRSKGQLLVEVIRTQLAARDQRFSPSKFDDPAAIFDLFIHPGSRELRMLQVDAAAAARHDIDVAAGMAEIYAARTEWIKRTMGATPDAETIAFVVNVLSAGVGMQEAHGQDLPDLEDWRRTVAAMFAEVFRETER